MDTNTSTPQDTTAQKEPFFGDVIRFAVIALIIVFPIRLFIAQPFIVSGASMEPTFENGEYLIVDQVTYRIEEPARGDVIIFRYPRDPSKFFIKRVIALPHETITIKDNTVTIYNDTHPDGMVLNEPYTATMHEDLSLSLSLGRDEYFVLGDNRDASSDSRTWGVLDRDLIIGRAFLRLLPVTELDLFPGKRSAEPLIQ